MLKRKKNSTLAGPLPVLADLAAVDTAERELLMDSLLKTVRDLGFQQVLPQPVEERRLYAKHPQLERYFGAKMWEVGLPRPLDVVLPPTYFLSIFKQYLKNWQSRGPHVAKWFYLTPVTEVADDRVATTHELGIFVLGEDSSLANAQLINAVQELLSYLGIKDIVTEINSLGCRVCQKDYQNLLQEYLRKGGFDLCADCRENVEENPILVWSCPTNACQNFLTGAPQVVDFLDEACRATLVGVLETVDQLGIPYTLNPTVAGRLPMEKILFRVSANESKAVLGSGGNYSSFSAYLGSEPGVPLLGFLTTFEKLWELVPPDNKTLGSHVEVFMVPLGELAARRALLLYRELRQAGVTAAEAMLGGGGIKNQLKEATDRRSDIALIIGQKEALEDTVILRDIRSGMQEVFSYDRIIEEVKKRLGR